MYGNPSKYSFVNFSKRVIDSLNSRCPDVKTANNDYGKKVFSVAFYESIVVFNIDSKKCFISSPSSNNGIKDPDTEDMWNKNSVAHSYLTILAALREAIPRVDNVPFARKIALKLYRVFNYLFFKIKSRELATFFRFYRKNSGIGEKKVVKEKDGNREDRSRDAAVGRTMGSGQLRV
jgi:hypothetical protein